MSSRGSVRAVVANRVALGGDLEGKWASAEDLVVLEPDTLFDAVYADRVRRCFPPGGKMTPYTVSVDYVNENIRLVSSSRHSDWRSRMETEIAKTVWPVGIEQMCYTSFLCWLCSGVDVRCIVDTRERSV